MFATRRHEHLQDRLEEDLAIERQANANYEAYRQRGVMRDGRRMSARPKPYTPPTIPDGKVNITDPDSKLVHGMRGWFRATTPRPPATSATSSWPPR